MAKQNHGGVPTDRRLLDLHASCWDRLIQAQHDRKSEFRWMNVATVDAHSNPQIRTVVLRSVNAKNRTLTFHTDKRSSKWDELNGNRAVALHFYARRASVQIRMSGNVTFPNESERQEAWQHLHDGARKTYNQAAPPRSVINRPEAIQKHQAISDILAYTNFAVVHVVVSKIDWLELGQDQHRRALFEYGEHNTLHAIWVAP